MREFRDEEEVDFVVVGTGAGGGPVIAGLAEQGFSVIGFDADPYFRPLEDFASVGAKDIFRQENDMNHLAGTARMGVTPEDSVINADCRSWDVPNPRLRWICLPHHRGE